MYSTPTAHRTSATVTPNHNLSIKLTPSPFVRGPKSPYRPRNAFDMSLCLKKIIGNTIATPNGFDSVPSSRTFAYTAGAAAVVITVQEDGSFSQRFFRARPTATPAPVNSGSNPTTPSNSDTRSRAPKDSGSTLNSSSSWTVDWSDFPSGKTWSSRERIKAATCISLTRDGKFLAVGETGYSPRVLVFSLLESSSDSPLEILSDHTYGVRAVAFSPDQKYLASLGSANDGFLYIWSFDKKTGSCKLHSSNRCTSTVRGMEWIGGNTLVTVGTRHVKVWRVETIRAPSPSKQRFAYESPQLNAQNSVKTLSGRNSVLGTLVEATFTAIVPISEGQAIICTEKGDICVLDDTDGGQKVTRTAGAGVGITCAALDEETRVLRVGGRAGASKTFDVEEVLSRTPSRATPSRGTPIPDENSALNTSGSTICAMCHVAGHWLDADNQHAITSQTAELASQGSSSEGDVLPFNIEQLSSHSDAVQGVQALSEPNTLGAAFYTYSSTGTVLFWSMEGRKVDQLQVELEQTGSTDNDWINSCTVCVASKSLDLFFVGDRFGVLMIIDTASRECVFRTKAHSSDILDIALYEDNTRMLLATCGRDRTAQLYSRIEGEFQLVQTLDEHTASVCGALFADNGEKLITCSADRTLNVRQIMAKDAEGQDVLAALTTRIITLKSAPVSMTLSTENPSNILVSTAERTVNTFEISSGRLISSFKAVDQESNEAVVMDSLVMGQASGTTGRPTILAGVSSTDKSIRVYDGNGGTFIDREWGHTASVTDIALLETGDPDKTMLISTGADGTIMMWELASLDSADAVDGDSKDLVYPRAPLRKVLSKADLAGFQRPSSSGRSSPPPPRTIRRKTSKFSMTGTKAQTPNAPPLSTSRQSSPAEDRDPPSPSSPRSREKRRPSATSIDARQRNKSSTRGSEFGSLNMATEQVCRTLRAWRSKVKSSESIREDLLSELDQELRLTAETLGERSYQNKSLSEAALTDILDQYSDRLITMLDQRLRLNFNASPMSETSSPTINRTSTPSTSQDSDTKSIATESASDKDA